MTFGQFRASRIPEVLGRCVNDTPYLMALCNEAIQRLLIEDEDGGFWGTTYRTAFNVVNDYIIAPREVARITDIAVCDTPVHIQNQFYEFLYAGNGLQSSSACDPCSTPIEAIDRGTVPITGTLPATNQHLRVYMTDTRDMNKRVFIAGKDQNGLVIREQDGFNWNYGFYLTLQSPFYTSAFIVTSISGVNKDITYGDVVLYAVDATTGVETLLSRYQADETVPAYRKYYLNHLPDTCCTTGTPVQVEGLCKLEYSPITKDTDFLLIGNPVALKEECMAIRYSEMETAGSQILADKHHKEALRILNKELKTYEGAHTPAVHVAIFGTATLDHHGIGSIR